MPHRWTNKWIDRQTETQIDKRTNRKVRQTNRKIDKYQVGLMMNKQTRGQKDGQKYRYTNIQIHKQTDSTLKQMDAQ